MTNKPSRQSAHRPKNICIVTGDLMEWGPYVEVGASVAAIAETLVSQGDEATILWVPGLQQIDEEEITRIKNYYYDQFLITVEVLAASTGLPPNLEHLEGRSAAVYYFLKEHAFDAVYFSLEGGLAYYTMIGKEMGLFAPSPTLVIIAHSPIQWLSESDRFFFRQWNQVAVAHMEKLSVELADRLVCVSNHIKEWMITRGWKLPDRVDVLPPLAPTPRRLRADFQVTRTVAEPCDEIVLLAGPEFRDGLGLFCDAVDELAKAGLPRLKLTAFGPFGQHLGEHTGGMLLRRARRWPFDVQIIPRLQYRDIVEYLSLNRALAVIPSLASETGHWVATCLDSGIPFVATAVGANTELFTAAQRAPQLVEPLPKQLAAKVVSTLKAPSPASSALTPEARRAAWLEFSRTIGGASGCGESRAKPADEEPLVSIVVVHHDRPQYLMQAIGSIERQSYRNIEVILVDDGSELPESKALLDRLELRFRARKWKILRQENKYLGAARNAGFRESRGEFVLVVDDDNALFRDAVRKFVSAMQTSGSDICTAFLKVFTGDTVPQSEEQGMIRYLPLGPVLDLGLMANTFGDANAIIRRTVFDKIGLQNETYGYTANDWEFYVRAALAGLKQRVIPEPLYWYRSSTQAMHRSSNWYDNRLPILAAYKKHNFHGLELMYHLAIAAFAPESEINGFRENLRRANSDWRYLQLSEMDANSTAAIELLAEIAAAEGRPDTALVLLGRAQTSNFRSTIVERLSAQPFLDNTPRELAAGFTTEHRLSHRDLMRLEASTSSLSGGVPLFYVESPDKCFLQSADGSTTVAVLPAGCPTLTIKAFLTASLDQELAAPAEMLVMLVPSDLDPVVAVQGAKRTPAEGSSGWCSVSVPFAPRKLEAVLPEPSDRPLSLVLAVRSKDDASKAVLGCFSAIGFKASVAKRATLRPRSGPPPTRRRARALERDEVARARLVSRFTSELPLLLLDPGDGGIFLRPAKPGPTVALIEYGFPSYARGLIARVEIAHDAASPFEFAIALALTSAQFEWKGEKPRDCVAFSGWVRVEDKFKLHDVALTLRDVSPSALHILLAIRLPPGSSPSPASSFWRKFVLVWDD